MESDVEAIRKEIRSIVRKHDGKVTFEDWDKKDETGSIATMIRAVLTFRIEQ